MTRALRSSAYEKTTPPGVAPPVYEGNSTPQPSFIILPPLTKETRRHPVYMCSKNKQTSFIALSGGFFCPRRTTAASSDGHSSPLARGSGGTRRYIMYRIYLGAGRPSRVAASAAVASSTSRDMSPSTVTPPAAFREEERRACSGLWWRGAPTQRRSERNKRGWGEGE